MQKTQEQKQTRTKPGLLATIGLGIVMACAGSGCLATYPLGTRTEMQYEWTNEYGTKMRASHSTLMMHPKMRERYERNTGKTFVP